MYSQLQEEAADGGTTGEASAEAALAEDAASADAGRPTRLESLKAEIARAMQVAADRERERIDASVGEEEAAQVEKIVTRAAAEAAELSKHADEDVSLVNAWYKDQVKQIRAEADRKIDDRRTGLEQSLTIHGSLIEAEIESVHIAVEGYRGSLGAFFGRLAEERDPSAIARLAGDLPDPPDLDEVRAEARSSAMQALEQRSTTEVPHPAGASSANGSEPAGLDRDPVPVMDPDAVADIDASIAAAVLATAPVEAPEATEPVASSDPSSVDDTVAAAESHAPEGVAVRLKRAITSWTSTPGAPEDR
ncbi:MAG: hypothetical protein M3P84_00035 [Chloroflexota bacterium]|nr:hypothetical protein [Chloroflexota bacterium]